MTKTLLLSLLQFSEINGFLYNFILFNYFNTRPPERGEGSWQPADVRTPPPWPGGSLYAALLTSLMIKFYCLLHPVIR